MSELIKDAPIGVFDSGFGGLTVVREIMRQIPNEKIIYFDSSFEHSILCRCPGHRLCRDNG